MNDLFSIVARSEGLDRPQVRRTMALRDTDVETTGTSLQKCKVVLGVTGGIAGLKRFALPVRQEGPN